MGVDRRCKPILVVIGIAIVLALFFVHSWRAYRIGKDFRQRMGVVNGGTYAYLIH